MIGVAVNSQERETAQEFFELFKTPWEFCQVGQRYDVVICTREQCDSAMAELLLIYRAEPVAFDGEKGIAVKCSPGGRAFAHGGQRLPLYGRVATFPASAFALPLEGSDGESLAFLKETEGARVLRIGYDLFQEVRILLTVGQPAANAGTPVLELHIALLRDLITGSGLPIVEIPPVPDGYGFITCLTHDLDHPLLRNHFCDHTMFGFLGRATIGSLVEVCRGRRSFGTLCRNWAAAGRLPFVYLGLAKDFWRGFDRYLELEAGLGSTYFVIPRKDCPGRQVDGNQAGRRAARYAVSEIKPQLAKVIAAGNEVALHGLDAWLDSASGCEERADLSGALGGIETGVRMHWLCLNEQSPAALDRAGFCYDSSFGYNETVGFRAGTAQAFKPIGAARMLELPLHIMDTALFYPRHLNLREAEAEALVHKLIEEVERFGGALTINWHDRSIAPERLWDAFYLRTLSELKRRGAWFPTAQQAVSWFRKRRAAAVDTTRLNGGDRIKVKGRLTAAADSLPSLRVRVHKPRARSLSEFGKSRRPAQFVDTPLGDTNEISIAL